MRYFFITQDKNLPGSIQYRDFDINGSRHVFSKEDSSQLDSVVALYLAGKSLVVSEKCCIFASSTKN